MRGVICTLSSEVEMPGEMPGERKGDLGISCGKFCGGVSGERLFRLRSREGMQLKKGGCVLLVSVTLLLTLVGPPRDL